MIKPIFNKIVVETNEEEVKSASGLIVPESVEVGNVKFGKVIAVGNGNTSSNGTLIPMTVKVNDIIAYPKFAPSEIKYNEKTYYVLSETDVIAIIEE